MHSAHVIHIILFMPRWCQLSTGVLSTAAAQSSDISRWRQPSASVKPPPADPHARKKYITCAECIEAVPKGHTPSEEYGGRATCTQVDRGGARGVAWRAHHVQRAEGAARTLLTYSHTLAPVRSDRSSLELPSSSLDLPSCSPRAPPSPVPFHPMAPHPVDLSDFKEMVCGFCVCVCLPFRYLWENTSFFGSPPAQAQLRKAQAHLRSPRASLEHPLELRLSFRQAPMSSL